MLTIFSLPKAFNGHINIIQRNAIQSWLKLRPNCEIILFGEEEGMEEAAKEFGGQHIPDIEKNEWGTPLLNSAFHLAQKLAKNDILVYVNSDIILMSDSIAAVQKIEEPQFLMCSRRWDLDIGEEINFNNPDWEENLRKELAKKGNLHGFAAIDQVVFPRNLLCGLPPFAVGRPGWDNWLIYHARSLKIPVIDTTEAITIVHQNHKSIYHPKGEEAIKNIKAAGGFSNMLTLRDADWILTPEGLRRPSFPRSLFVKLSLFYPWRLILALKRKLQFRF